MLTDDQLNHIGKRLLEERTRALSELNRSQATAAQGELESTGDLSEAPTHNADRGTETEDAEIAASLAEREIGEVAEIDAALERLYKHPREFGRDERTGKDIPLPRLDLIPWARTA
jgi:RNA polymerase-binding transcription factor DksA